MSTHPGPPEAAAQRLVRRARAIIAGEESPEPIVPPPSVAAALERRPHPLTPAERLRLSNELSLQAVYGGLTTACFHTPEGALAVLASGDDEVRALVAALTDAERKHVTIKCPDPPLDLSAEFPDATRTVDPGRVPQGSERVGRN